MENLTKRDLVVQITKAIRPETRLTQSEVFSIIQKTLDHITNALARGQNVELRNFGVFEVVLTKLRVGRNPKNPQADVPIPPYAKVKFSAGKIMRERVLSLTEKLLPSSFPLPSSSSAS